uniref:Uncharacterized protein n=1 Tax=Arundo donax TaxID=35708 RepID=A0A0A9B7M2_ARUDO
MNDIGMIKILYTFQNGLGSQSSRMIISRLQWMS